MTLTTSIVLLVMSLLLLCVGGALGWLAGRSRASSDVARLQATLDVARHSEQQLQRNLQALNNEAVRQHTHELGRLVTPLHTSLAKVEEHVAAVERERIRAYAALNEQVRSMHATSEQLRAETTQLVTALRAPQVRGRWGEHQLRRIVEASGMVEHCDFAEQQTTTSDHGTLRPDMVITLAGGKHVVVDAKVPFAAYLEAMEAKDDAVRRARLTAHARALRAHIDGLSAKAYHQQFEPTPEFTVLFVPADTFLDAALQQDATLLEHGFARDIVIATPSTLIALLRTIAYTWRQDALAANAAAVRDLGKELHARLSVMGGHVTRLGSALTGAVDAFNKTVSSMESRVLVTARRFEDLQVTTDHVAELSQVDRIIREPQAPELVASAADTLVDLGRAIASRPREDPA